MTPYNNHTKSLKKKMEIYKDSKYSSTPLCEQVALLFDSIYKKIEISEELYARKDFENGYKIVKDNMELCGKLCEVLTDLVVKNNEVHHAQTWVNYFGNLMHTLVLLSSNHNVTRKEKLLKNVKDMAIMWRNRGKELNENQSIKDPSNFITPSGAESNNIQFEA